MDNPGGGRSRLAEQSAGGCAWCPIWHEVAKKRHEETERKTERDMRGVRTEPRTSQGGGR